MLRLIALFSYKGQQGADTFRLEEDGLHSSDKPKESWVRIEALFQKLLDTLGEELEEK